MIRVLAYLGSIRILAEEFSWEIVQAPGQLSCVFLSRLNFLQNLIRY